MKTHYNPAKLYYHEVIDGKRVGRKHNIRTWLSLRNKVFSKDRTSWFNRFYKGRKSIMYNKNRKINREFLEDFALFFKKIEPLNKPLKSY